MALIKSVLVAGTVGLCLLVLLAGTRGRSSRYYRFLAAVVSPVSERFLAKPDSQPVTIPYEARLGKMMEPGWQWYQPHLIEVERLDSSLSFIPTGESVWWMNERGPMVYRTLIGDASIVASIRTRKQSDPTSPPDMEWQFAGIILRDPRGDAIVSRENYVFSVVGHRGSRLQVETKSTRQGVSQVNALDWETGDADLKIKRTGSRFQLLARRRDSHAEWLELIEYDRSDLPDKLQVGLIAYAYSEGRGRHDMRALFDRLSIQRASPEPIATPARR